MKVIAIVVELDDGTQVMLQNQTDVERLVKAHDQWQPAMLRLDYNWSQRLHNYEMREAGHDDI